MELKLCKIKIFNMAGLLLCLILLEISTLLVELSRFNKVGKNNTGFNLTFSWPPSFCQAQPKVQTKASAFG